MTVDSLDGSRGFELIVSHCALPPPQQFQRRHLRIVRKLEPAPPVRLETMRTPDALDGTGADAGRLGHHGARPMRRLSGRIGHGQGDDALADRVAERFDARRAVLSRSRPSKPSSMNRSCQRQTQVFDFPSGA